MSSRAVDLGRRKALKLGGFSLAFVWLGTGKAQAFMSARAQPGDRAFALADGHPAFAPNAFIRIDAEGPVRLVMPQVEMGQGIYTGACALLAEELDIGMDQIKIEHAPPSDELYGIPALGGQATGGSTSTRTQWGVLREAAAIARSMLVTAAANRWHVDPADCAVRRGMVSHDKSGRKLKYGALATAAAALPIPAQVPLKDPATFSLIGKPLRRIDSADKVIGATQFGIDARVPGMKIATVRGCPTFGGKLKSVQDERARQVPGFVQVLKLDNAVAVVGEHFWAAKQGSRRARRRVGPGGERQPHDRQSSRTVWRKPRAARRSFSDASRARSRRRGAASRLCTSCRCWRTHPWSLSTRRCT